LFLFSLQKGGERMRPYLPVRRRDEIAEIYYREIRNIPLLTTEEERRLLEKSYQGDELAKRLLVVSNLRFAFSQARKFYGKALRIYGQRLRSTVSLSDLIQEANLGLIKAAEKYDPTKYEVRFLAYADYWISHQMQRFLQEKGFALSRIPLHIQDLRLKVEKAKEKFQTTIGIEPSLAELSETLGIPQKTLIRLELIEQQEIRLESFLDSDSDKGETFEEIIAKGTKDLYEANFQAEALLFRLRFLLRELFQGLDSREKLILLLRFGFFTEKPLTLKQIGKELGLTRERVRQIEKKALEKIRKKLTQKEREEIRRVLGKLQETRYF